MDEKKMTGDENELEVGDIAENAAGGDASAEAEGSGEPLLSMRPDEKKKVDKKKVIKEVREWVVSLLVAVAVVLLLRSFVFTIIRVEGPSMQDTLFTGDRIMVSIIDTKISGFDRFDVVVCHFPNRDQRFVKRIIGLPGETLEVRSGVTYIDDEPVYEPFLEPDNTKRYHSESYDFGPVEIPEDCYFVMGDNRDDSSDSRAVGVIERGMMVGRARYIIWPFDRLNGVPGSDVYSQ